MKNVVIHANYCEEDDETSESQSEQSTILERSNDEVTNSDSNINDFANNQFDLNSSVIGKPNYLRASLPAQINHKTNSMIEAKRKGFKTRRTTMIGNVQ